MALNWAKKIVRKFLALITLIFWGFSTVFATDFTLDFNTPSDYTSSNTNEAFVHNSLAQLKKQMSHSGVIVHGGSTLLDGAYEVVVDGNYAYVSSYDADAIEILDISTPSTPTHVASIVDNAGSLRLDGPMGIVKDGNYLYVASNLSDALQIIDVSTPASPIASGQLLDNGGTRRLNGARGITKVGNYVYVTGDVDDGLNIIDVSTPASPTLAGSIRNTTTLNGARGVAVSGNYAYVAAYDGDRFTVIDISTPASPSIVTNIRNNNTSRKLNGARSILIDGNYAYVTANLSNALQVIDITTPNSPLAVTNVSTGVGSFQLDGALDIKKSGNYLYVSGNTSDAVNIIDVVDPSNPVFVSSISHNISNPLLDGITGISVVGNLIYAASINSDSLEILDIFSPSSDPYIVNNTSISLDSGIFNIEEELGSENTGSTRYQLSNDGGTTWYYYNSGWTVAGSASYSLASDISTINSNIVSFYALGGTNNFKIRSFLHSNGTQVTELDNLTISTDTTGPTIDAFSPSYNGLIPHGDFYILLDISDNESGVDTTSDSLILKKWNGASWGADISATYVDFGSSVVTSNSAQYPVNNLPYGKYMVTYSIDDMFGNTSIPEEIVFYVDGISWNISAPSIDIGVLSSGVPTYSSDELIVTVNTVGAGFQVYMTQSGSLSSGGDTINSWDGIRGCGYDIFPYTPDISSMASSVMIANQTGSINTNGDLNTYEYKIKYGALIDTEKMAGEYSSLVNFGISIDYEDIGVCTVDETQFGCSL